MNAFFSTLAYLPLMVKAFRAQGKSVRWFSIAYQLLVLLYWRACQICRS